MFDFLNKTIKGLFGTKADKDIKELSPFVAIINEAHVQIKNISDDELRNKTIEFKALIASATQEKENSLVELKKQAEEDSELGLHDKEELYKQIDTVTKEILEITEQVLLEILPQAFAVVKETATRFTQNQKIRVKANNLDRDIAAIRNHVKIEGDYAVYENTWMVAGTPVTWNMIHYDVQLIGGVVLHQGKIAEMATGEGKTLVATLPIYLNALAGKGVHVVTVNDYLARRDAEWNGPIFEFLGLKVDCIDKHQPHSIERKNAYLADITYGTNNEFGFDYLRDNMGRNQNDLVQRSHHFAIIDEVDSVLIDDARTPLIISGPTTKGDQQEFHGLKPRIEKIVGAQRNLINTYLADAKKKFAEGKEDEAGLPLLKAFRGLPKNKALIKFLSETGVRTLLQKTENFHLQDHGKEMRKLDADLFFVIDEKNNSIELTDKGIDLITQTGEDSSFFIMTDVGAGIAEIEKSVLSDQEKADKKEILLRDFSIKSERLHTTNQLLKAYTLFERDVEYVVMDGKVKIVDEQTGRILEGRRYSDGLHQAIEAKENVKVEAATQTYATITLQNYFRMFHKLSGMTGTAETEAGELWEIYKLDVVVIPTNRPIVRKDMEDMVFKTTREKYNAVIDEIVHLKEDGRPVLVGTTSVEVSELLSKMLSLRKIKHNVLNAKQHQREADIVAEAGQPGMVTIATNMAGRGTDIKLGAGVKEKGGLAIIGTERHESRRVDRQLRGRAGRQGDPGSSQFYVSLEDNLMRLFGSERIARLMDRMGLKEGEVIQHSLVTRSIERAQKKVEENNFGIRKRLLEYDDVMNSQREVIYKKRKHALSGERLSLDIINMLLDLSESMVEQHRESRSFDDFKVDLVRYLGINTPVEEETFLKAGADEISEQVYAKSFQHYKDKSKLIAQNSFPVIQDVYTKQGTVYQDIVIPFTDGQRGMQVVANLKKCYESNGKEVVAAFERAVTLALIDAAWTEHLREMDDLKTSVQSAVYEQKDPLIIYKFESFELFKQLVERINKDILSFILKGNIAVQNAQQVTEAKQPARTDTSKLKASHDESLSALTGGTAQAPPPRQEQKTQPIRVEQKIGRNDPCPCGSGKKYKSCHGAGVAAS